MKKILIFLTIAFFAQVHAQRSIHQDSTAVPVTYSDYKRAGEGVVARSESGLFRFLLSDSTGYLMTREPVIQAYQHDTLVASINSDTLALGDTYDYFEFYADSAEVYKLSFSADSADFIRLNNGTTVVKYYVSTDTLSVKMVTDTLNIMVNMFKFKRF